VLAASGGALWMLWERSQHDPWLRLLARVRRKLGKAGVHPPSAAPPREMAQLVRQRFGETGQPLHDWLIRMETQRYSRNPQASLATLQSEFRQLAWPS
jgi:hypothetical protein